MKERLAKKLAALEAKSLPLALPQLLDAWIEKHWGKERVIDYWQLLERVPQELKAECLFRGLDQIKTNFTSKHKETSFISEGG